MQSAKVPRQTFPNQIEDIAGGIVSFGSTSNAALEIQNDMNVVAVGKNVHALFGGGADNGIGAPAHFPNAARITPQQVPVLPSYIFRGSAKESFWVELRNGQIRVRHVIHDLRLATLITDPGANI